MKKLLITLMTATLLLGGCTITNTTKDILSSGLSKVDEIKDAGTLTMYTNAEFPPYEFYANNEIVGVDIEIGKTIAEKLGVELNVINADFDGIVASIATGRGDLAISGITITEERKESVDFSTPYVDSVQYLILPEDTDIAFVEDMKGKDAGTQAGTTGELFFTAEIEEGVLVDSGSSIKSYKSALAAMQDLIVGRISAVVVDELVAISIANENDGYKAIPFIYESGEPVKELYGVAIRKGNDDLMEIVNEVVQDMLDKGLIDEYIEYYSQMHLQ